jgi:hypothetical protein
MVANPKLGCTNKYKKTTPSNAIVELGQRYHNSKKTNPRRSINLKVNIQKKKRKRKKKVNIVSSSQTDNKISSPL